jgi:hypothetical protein
VTKARGAGESGGERLKSRSMLGVRVAQRAQARRSIHSQSTQPRRHAHFSSASRLFGLNYGREWLEVHAWYLVFQPSTVYTCLVPAPSDAYSFTFLPISYHFWLRGRFRRSHLLFLFLILSTISTEIRLHLIEIGRTPLTKSRQRPSFSASHANFFWPCPLSRGQNWRTETRFL